MENYMLVLYTTFLILTLVYLFFVQRNKIRKLTAQFAQNAIRDESFLKSYENQKSELEIICEALGILDGIYNKTHNLCMYSDGSYTIAYRKSKNEYATMLGDGGSSIQELVAYCEYIIKNKTDMHVETKINE